VCSSDLIEDAQAVLDGMVERAGREHWAWLDAIESSISLGQPDAAHDYFVRACRDLDLSFAEWLGFAEKIDISAARAIILEKLRATLVADPALLVRMARVAFRQGDTRLALALAHQASDHAPHDPSFKAAIVEIAYYHSEFERHGFDLNDLAFPSRKWPASIRGTKMRAFLAH